MFNRGSFCLFAGLPSYSSITLDLIAESTVIDMLGLLSLNFKKLRGWQSDPSLFTPADLQRLKASGVTILHPAVGYVDGDIYAESLRDVTAWRTFVGAHSGEFLAIERASDVQKAKSLGKIGIIAGQQNSSHFRSVEDVNAFYDMGQRVSQLTYVPNRIGGGSSDPHDSGLTSYGAQIIERMNSVGMAIDVSHCGDRTTLDAIEASRKPVLITHSNCRALVSNSARCKTDAAIRSLAAKGGVMGVTMIRPFVRPGGPTTIENVLDHIDHVARLVGVEHVGLGTDVDFDGRDQRSAPKHSDIDGVDYQNKIFDLTEGLVRRKYSGSDIRLILGGNFQRVLGAIWVP